jgi:glycosyltransferase involved in cell wall biosynthesis
VNVVHQPIPLAPKDPTLIFNLGVPVVIGPLNGAMTYPTAFAKRQSSVERGFMSVGRWLADVVHLVLPGKRTATTLLIANERTRAGLPRWCRGRVILQIDNSVDLSTWRQAPTRTRTGRKARFVYLGRLVDWKAVDLLIHAFAPVARTGTATLDLIGDGELGDALKAQVQALGISDHVNFLGWKQQAQCAEELATADALVLPSLYECGGAVVLEAMAVGLPVIATAWGGPADYLDKDCGILVEPSSRDAFINGLSSAMLKLASDPDLRERLGQAARRKVETHFDWEKKIDDTLTLYREAIQRYPLASTEAPATSIAARPV